MIPPPPAPSPTKNDPDDSWLQGVWQCLGALHVSLSPGASSGALPVTRTSGDTDFRYTKGAKIGVLRCVYWTNPIHPEHCKGEGPEAPVTRWIR